ncbi:hypothetical protein CAEBREN_13636 [Caenorhabditis brenneri]|uniref:Uncharacterized protein n=1 Tax=Caenorhabditis brenneri TaxID=135651 RepID=G0N6W3_CAEBE|nr:hypothetical protein CAEBREN_13636 [Caenorhabditis brenneri]
MSNQLLNAYKQRGRPRPPSPPGSVRQQGSVNPSGNGNPSNSRNRARQAPPPIQYGHPENRPRDPEIGRLPEYLRRLKRPIIQDVRHQNVTMYISDVVDTNYLIHWANKEGNWMPNQENPNFMDAGGLRYYVWLGALPDPETHYQECVKRLPCLDLCPDGREYFVRNARAQHEPREGDCTNRCPWCQSSLFGYPMYDHTQGNCPFDVLEGDDRARFLACNNMAYCPACNCRSPFHTECTPRHKFCSECKSTGHTTTERFCGLDIGLPDEESKEKLQTLVRKAREEVFERVRWAARYGNPEMRCLYRIHMDHSHTRTFRELSKGAPLIGWGPYIDSNPQTYPPLSRRMYLNWHLNRPDSYDALTPVEYAAHEVLPIIHLDVEIHELLKLAATKVDAIKRGADPYTLYMEDLYTASERAVTLSEARMALWQQGEQPPEAPTVNYYQETGGLANQTQQRPLRRPLPSPHALPDHANYYRHPNDQWLPDEGNRAGDQYEQQPSRNRAESYSCGASNRSFGALPSSSQPGPSNAYQDEVHDRGNQTLPAQSNSSRTPFSEQYQAADPYQDQTSSVGYPYGPTTLTSAAKEEGLEKTLSRHILSMCRNTIPVGKTPARVLFQAEAHDLLLNAETPQSHHGLATRIRTIQLMLTGNYETTDWSRYTVGDLQSYVTTLMLFADLLKDEPLLVTQLEETCARHVTIKFNHGADVTRIPSYTLSKTVEFANAFKGIQRGPRGTEPHRRFFRAGPRQRWILDQEFRRITNGPKAAEATQDESRRVSTLNLERYNISAYSHPSQLLRELLGSQPPFGVQAAMKLRVVYTLKLLTGKPVPRLPDVEERDLDTLHLYYMVLLGACRVVNEIRSLENRHLTIKVSLTKCLPELAAIATGLHDIPVPDLTLFSQFSTSYWFAWLDTVWTSRFDDAKNSPCRCQLH